MKLNNPKLFRDLDLSWIKNAVVVLDIDGTLLADNKFGDGKDPSAVNAVDDATLAKARELGGRNQVYLVSNGKNHERCEHIASQIGNVKYHPTDFYKPNPKCVKGILPQDERPVFVIGDKVLTDGLLALRIDAPFIQVASLRTTSESNLVKIAHSIDKISEKIIGGIIPTINTGERSYTLLTEVPYTYKHFSDILYRLFKKALKSLIYTITQNGRYGDIGGPAAVQKSLIAGLMKLNVPFKLNPWAYKISGTVCVLRDEKALRWALERKKKGFITKIIAGPNIVVSPTDYDGIIKDSGINTVVVPSDWNKRWWMTFDQALEARAEVWAAGVEDFGAGRNPNGVCIVYSKNPNEKLFHKIMEVLWNYKLPIVVSEYGKFKQKEYFRLLKNARMLVYLSESESQGIALHEAWMADIPALVWNRGYFEHKGQRFTDLSIGAPYLTEACGISFSGEEDFEQKLIEFNERYDSFKPRAYSLGHFTNEISARKYITIVEKTN